MTTYRIDVNIVDDHTMLNEGLTEALNHNAKIHVSRSFSTLAECRDALKVRQPDVLLLDISMPDGDGDSRRVQHHSSHPRGGCQRLCAEERAPRRTGRGYLQRLEGAEIYQSASRRHPARRQRQVYSAHQRGAEHSAPHLRRTDQSADSAAAQPQRRDHQMVSQAPTCQIRRQEHRQSGDAGHEREYN